MRTVVAFAEDARNARPASLAPVAWHVAEYDRASGNLLWCYQSFCSRPELVARCERDRERLYVVRLA